MHKEIVMQARRHETRAGKEILKVRSCWKKKERSNREQDKKIIKTTFA